MKTQLDDERPACTVGATKLPRRRPVVAGFSLIETMIAVAMVGVMGTGVASLLVENNRQYSITRANLLISSAAQQTFERLISIAGTSRVYGGSTDFCESVIANGGPLFGGTVDGSSNTCPTDYIVRDIAIPETHLTKTVTMRTAAVGTATGLELIIEVTNPRTSSTLEIRTLIGAF